MTKRLTRSSPMWGSIATPPECVPANSGVITAGSVSLLGGATANFGSVVDNQDFAYVSSCTGTCTGFAAAKYLITSHTSGSVTVNSNLATACTVACTGITYQIVTGHNFAPRNSALAAGYPGVLPLGGLNTGYLWMRELFSRLPSAAASVSVQ